MSKMKRILAVLLTVIMTVAMTVNAFAEGTKNSIITISGVGIDADATVKYEQIIKENPQSIYGWQFTNNDIKSAFVNGWNSAKESSETDLDADGVIAAMISSGMIEETANGYVTTGTINPSAKFNAAVAAVANVNPSLLTKSMSNIGTEENVVVGAHVSSTGAGLYIVTAQKEGYTYLPMAAYMSFAGDDVAIQAKGSTNQINKVVAESGQSVAPGDEVDYTITQQYLYIAPQALDKTFTITDTLTNGAFKENSVVIKIKDTSGTIDAIEDRDYTINSYAGKTQFTVNFGEKYNSDYAGKTVEINYTVIVGNVTTDASETLKNFVKSSNGTGKIVETKPVSFKVVKVDSENNTLKLEGAKFQIYKAVDSNSTAANKTELMLADKTKVYGVPVGGEITTNSSGEAVVNNLDAQETYYVKETQAPAGYSLNDTAYQLAGASVTEADPTTETIGDVSYTKMTYNYTNFSDQTITDTKLSALPSTGGIGTTIFTVAGCLIMICAAGLLFASRRKTSK